MNTKRLAVAALLTVAGAVAVILLLPSPFVQAPDAEPSRRAIEVAAEQAPSGATIARQAAGTSAGRLGQQAAEGDCLTALATPEGSSQMMQEERLRHIERFLEGQDDRLSQALAADLAGVVEQEPPDGRPFTSIQYLHYRTPLPDDERQLSYDERQQLTDLLTAEGIEGLVALGDASLLAAKWKFNSTSGHLIREYAEGHLRGLPAVADELSIGLHELGTAIEVGLPPSDFAVLLDAADVDPAATWLYGVNLAKLAAIHNRPAILRLLAAQGINPVAAGRWGHRSVLDDIAASERPPDADRAAALADVVRQLVAAGDRPYLPSTLSTLADWLPEVGLPELHPDSAVMLQALEEAAQALAELDAEWAAKIAAAKRLEARCESQLADPEVALAAFKGKDLASKLRYREALDARLERLFEERDRAAEAAPTDGEGGDDAPVATAGQRDILDELFSLAGEGRWQQALALADEVGGYAHMAVLSVALTLDTPLDVLLALARRVDAMPPPERTADTPDWLPPWTPLGDGVMALANNPRADIAAVVEALEPFGLDLHYVDLFGRNAFHELAGWPRDDEALWRFAELLVSRSVSVKPRPYGLDPLDTVLTRLARFSRGGSETEIQLARFLIDHGAPIEASHLQLARQLAVADEEAYRRLVSAVPELAG